MIQVRVHLLSASKGAVSLGMRGSLGVRASAIYLPTGWVASCSSSTTLSIHSASDTRIGAGASIAATRAWPPRSQAPLCGHRPCSGKRQEKRPASCMN